jgi:hypothetical protein
VHAPAVADQAVQVREEVGQARADDDRIDDDEMFRQ